MLVNVLAYCMLVPRSLETFDRYLRITIGNYLFILLRTLCIAKCLEFVIELDIYKWVDSYLYV